MECSAEAGIRAGAVKHPSSPSLKGACGLSRPAEASMCLLTVNNLDILLEAGVKIKVRSFSWNRYGLDISRLRVPGPQ